MRFPIIVPIPIAPIIGPIIGLRIVPFQDLSIIRPVLGLGRPRGEAHRTGLVVPQWLLPPTVARRVMDVDVERQDLRTAMNCKKLVAAGRAVAGRRRWLPTIARLSAGHHREALWL